MSFTVPLTLLVLLQQPNPLEASAFQELAALDHPHTCTTQFKIPSVDGFQWTLTRLCQVLKAHLVECLQDSATFYGKDVHGNHVLGLVKMKQRASSVAVSLQLKGTNQPLLEAIIDEVGELV